VTLCPQSVYPECRRACPEQRRALSPASPRHLCSLRVSAVSFFVPRPTHCSLSLLFSYSSALFCTFLHSAKSYLPYFQANPHSFCKTPGVGYPTKSQVGHSSLALLACPDPVGATFLHPLPTFSEEYHSKALTPRGSAKVVIPKDLQPIPRGSTIMHCSPPTFLFPIYRSPLTIPLS
jgi:hypothetical protein